MATILPNLSLIIGPAETAGMILIIKGDMGRD